jgi:cell division septation protein DedD
MLRIIKSSLIGFTLFSSSLLLSSCSQVNGLLKSNNDAVEKDSALVVPPTLRLPTIESGAKKTTPTIMKKNVTQEVVDNKNYYVVVGTYPNQDQALDTFVRLSSIGLPHAAMESRNTKAGTMLHMVRLGPFHKQSEIDRVKDKLVNDGMSQFKVVVN